VTSAASNPEAIKVRPIGRDDFPLIETLFGARGACGGCWCMTWRAPSLGAWWNEHKGEPNRLAFKALVESGKAHGCLAFDGEKPVGWCSIGPRDDFDYLKRARLIPDSGLTGVWSLTCFYIPVAYQKKGVSGRLIEGACASARALGAQWLEGYPTARVKSANVPPAFAHTGFLGPFLRCGFEVAADAGARAVVRRKL
jgi:hypothetical protein